MLLSYSLGWSVGPSFVLINLPFFILAQRRMGWAFTLKSIASMIALAVITQYIPVWLKVGAVERTFAAVFGGSLIGMGVLSLARHRSSVGGIGILGLILQESRGWNAGLIQMLVDLVIVALAIAAVGPARAAYSLISAVSLNVVMIAYHRPGRYAGQ